LPQAQYDIGTQEAIAPREQELAAQLFRKYTPQYAEVGQNVDLQALRGAGGQAVREGNALQQEIDPEFYASRAATSGKLRDLLGGMDPNRLTTAEREEVARGLARTQYGSGELAVPSNQGAIEAAQTFGSALTNKRNAVANAIDTATRAIPSFRTGVDAFQQGTSGARFGVNPFAGGQTNALPGGSQVAGQQAGQAALGLTGSLQQLRAQLQAQRRDELDRTNETFSGTLGSIL
jgi:hypothetical protein